MKVFGIEKKVSGLVTLMFAPAPALIIDPGFRGDVRQRGEQLHDAQGDARARAGVPWGERTSAVLRARAQPRRQGSDFSSHRAELALISPCRLSSLSLPSLRATRATLTTTPTRHTKTMLRRRPKLMRRVRPLIKHSLTHSTTRTSKWSSQPRTSGMDARRSTRSVRRARPAYHLLTLTTGPSALAQGVEQPGYSHGADHPRCRSRAQQRGPREGCQDALEHSHGGTRARARDARGAWGAL